MHVTEDTVLYLKFLIKEDKLYIVLLLAVSLPYYYLATGGGISDRTDST